MTRYYLPRSEHPDIDWVLPLEYARDYDRDTPTWEDGYYPCGVTGQRFFPSEWPTAESTPKWVQLVPMPDNEYDDCALRVVHNGSQIGWVPAKSSYHLAPFIQLLKAEGSACKVPLTEPEAFNAYDPDSDESFKVIQIGAMLLPTRNYLYRKFRPAILFSELDRVWELLNDEQRNNVRRNGYRFGRSIAATTQRFTTIGKAVTDYPFELPVESDSIIIQYLVWYRRMIEQYTTKRKRAERNLWICDSTNEGKTNREIASKVGLQPSTVGEIKRNGNDPKKREQWLSSLSEFPADEAGMAKYVLSKHF